MKHIVSAIITAGVVSLGASLLFLLVGAPDVAMTEAAIGSALTTVIFLFAWSRIRDFQTQEKSGSVDDLDAEFEEAAHSTSKTAKGEKV